jgi:hypothetical protein
MQDLLHQLQRAGNHRAAGFPRVEEIFFVHFLGHRVMADEDDLDVFVSAGEEEVEQHEEALGDGFLPSSIEPDTSMMQNITAWVVGLGTLMRLL